MNLVKKEGSISVSERLTLSVRLGDSDGTYVTVKLDRIAAQELADGLNQYAGRHRMSAGRKSFTSVSASIAVDDKASRKAEVAKILGRAR